MTRSYRSRTVDSRTPRTGWARLPLGLWLLLPWLAATLACGAESGGATVWRFAIEESPGSVQDHFARAFAERLAERSGGAIEVKVYTQGTLGTSDDLVEQVRMGSLQFAMASPGHLGKLIPEVQAFLLHFQFGDDPDVIAAALADPQLRAVVAPLYAERELALLSLFSEGWMVWTANEPLRSPADFAGVKIRTMTSPVLLETYEAYGASPQAMPYGEVYSGLQLAMIDAQVNPVFAIEEMSFYEVNPVLTHARPAPFVCSLVSGRDFLEGLPEDQQALIREVLAEVEAEVEQVQRAFNAERLEQMAERQDDLQSLRLDESERDAFRALAAPVRQAFAERTGPRAREVLEAITAAVDRARGG